MNLDGYNDATHEVTGNLFDSAGSGVSVGAPVTTTYAGIHDNVFRIVGTEFNLQNTVDLTPDQFIIDLTATNNELATSGSDGVVVVLGGAAGDDITGSTGIDGIAGNGGADT